jgi:hypothetical protein
MEKNDTSDIQSIDTSLLEELRPKDLTGFNLAPGDIYWKKTNGKLIALYRAGEFFSHTKIKKFFERDYKLVYRPVGHRENRLQLEVALGRFLSSDFEVDRLKYRRQFLGLIKTYYWDSFEESSLLDLVLVFDSHFNLWVKHNEEFLIERPDVQKRNALIGSLNALGAIFLSYNHFHYLQDLYNVVFLVDCSYQKTMTPKLFDLLDSEHISDKDFAKSQEGLTKAERAVFEDHPRKDFELAQKDFGDIFTYQSSLRFLKRQHEFVVGNGFPRGVNQEELSDIELWGLIMTRLFSWKQLEYKNDDGYEAVKNVLGLKFRKETETKYFVGRRISMLVSGLMENLAPVRDVA